MQYQQHRSKFPQSNFPYAPYLHPGMQATQNLNNIQLPPGMKNVPPGYKNPLCKNPACKCVFCFCGPNCACGTLLAKGDAKGPAKVEVKQVEVKEQLKPEQKSQIQPIASPKPQIASKFTRSIVPALPQLTQQQALPPVAMAPVAIAAQQAPAQAQTAPKPAAAPPLRGGCRCQQK